jgi:hypothetical protein
MNSNSLLLMLRTLLNIYCLKYYAFSRAKANLLRGVFLILAAEMERRPKFFDDTAMKSSA